MFRRSCFSCCISQGHVNLDVLLRSFISAGRRKWISFKRRVQLFGVSFLRLPSLKNQDQWSPESVNFCKHVRRVPYGTCVLLAHIHEFCITLYRKIISCFLCFCPKTLASGGTLFLQQNYLYLLSVSSLSLGPFKATKPACRGHPHANAGRIASHS